MSKALASLGRISLALVLLVLTPLSFSGTSSEPVLSENSACAAKGEEVNCKPELDAVCTSGGSTVYDHYLDR